MKTAREVSELSEKRLKQCENGHSFYKSSDCPVCPVCSAAEKPEDGFLALLSAPARRALTRAGITRLEELRKFSQKEILGLHGVGPATLPILQRALTEAGLDWPAAEA